MTIPRSSFPIAQILKEAGYDFSEQPPSAELLRLVEQLCRRASEAPFSVVCDALRSLRITDECHKDALKAKEAADKLEEVLAKVLESDRVLCRLECLQRDGASPARAICRISGQLRELPVHPDVPLAQLESLKPWDCVLVNAREMVVVGAISRPELFAQAHGAVAEFKGYFDRERGLARVAREGHEEEIVTLASSLGGLLLTAPSKLVLHRDDERLAIATLPADRIESRFEVSIAEIQTRLEDLAGMDGLIERLIEDTVKRVIHPGIGEEFDEKPLNGLMLYSYKPGMGKTALARAYSRWLHECGQEQGFDVVLYVVPPNGLKSMWHGGDGMLVRGDLCGSIRARIAMPRRQPLICLVVLDEVDSLGKRGGGNDRTGFVSSAQNDAVQALIAEMDGMVQLKARPGEPPAHVLWWGMTNRPDLVDDALKRPGRLDLLLEMPDLSPEAAEAILSIYARRPELPWLVDGEVRRNVPPATVRERFLRPALVQVFDATVLRYTSEGAGQRLVEATAGQVMAGAHLEAAMNGAKRRASRRRLLGTGVPALSFEDVVESLMEQALGAAKQMEADHQMLQRQLRLKAPVAQVELVSAEDLSSYRYRRM